MLWSIIKKNIQRIKDRNNEYLSPEELTRLTLDFEYKHDGPHTIDIRTLGKAELSAILEKATGQAGSGNNWYEAFPEVTGYKYYIPEGYDDLEEYPDTFRGVDHAIAHETVKHPGLYPGIAEMLEKIIIRNIFGDEVLLADMYEHAGTSYAVELALAGRQFIKQYAGFLCANDIYYEKYQHFDFVRIVCRWGWCSETYYLLFAHLFSQSRYFQSDMDYLHYNGYPLHKDLLEDKEETDMLLGSLTAFLMETGYRKEDEDLYAFVMEMFGQLVRKHIYPDNRIIYPQNTEKADKLEKHCRKAIGSLPDTGFKIQIPIQNKGICTDDDIPEI